MKDKRKNVMLIDSHAHLDDEAFNEDREELIAQIRDAGIEYVVNIAASLSSIKTSMELADRHDFIYTSVGVHPCETKELGEENFEWMKQQLFHEKVRAVGEIGLEVVPSYNYHVSCVYH